ncbi:MAG TPA: T9SS type A sorting domain-containing protein [Flavipsychrobacter sp.]|nr:T9SS type A sorting domain-containing protein [Flavipsychrobacter sp.]
MSIKNALSSFILCVIVFICFNTFQAFAQTPDPGLPGPYTVARAEYNLGALAYKPADFPDSVEVRGSVHYPTDLSAGPFPVLVFLHGRHETCYDTTDPSNISQDWPCSGTYAPITSFNGYDYLAKTMASHGYIVISISCNAINAGDDTVSDGGMQARAELMQHHLDLWNKYNTVGGAPFDTMFVGKLDMNNIGTMGHSRGGEGVVFHALYNKLLGSPYGIKAVLTLAPVNFSRKVLHQIPLMNIAPYCDGDVSDLEGVHFYDDARYTDSTDETPKYSVLFMGANHNFFNTVWTPGSYIAGGADDWEYFFSDTDPQCGPDNPANKRFDTTTEKAAFNAYAAAFFRMYIGHETAFAPILQVNNITPPASSKLDSSQVFVSYHPGHTDRFDINRIDKLACDTINTIDGKVTETGLLLPGICGGGPLLYMYDCEAGLGPDQKPHDGDIYAAGLAQMRLGWSSGADYYQNEVPLPDQDLTSFESLMFRTSVDFPKSTSDSNLDFSIQLIDSAGNISSRNVSNYTNALFHQPGIEPGDLPKIVFNTIRMPLSDFSGIDMTKVRKIKFVFDKSTKGTILISDLALLSKPCGKLNVAFDFAIDSEYKVTFTNTSATNVGDTIAWHWNFEDTLSGANDSSALQNITHSFSGPGTYYPCLYVRSNRKNGVECLDTFCIKLTLSPDAIIEQIKDRITIAPNPAKDYLRITGISKPATLTLINLYGQIVLSATITGSDVYLPQTITTGIYCVAITTPYGKVYKKVLVSR